MKWAWDILSVYIVTLTLVTWPGLKVMTHPEIIDNNGVKYIDIIEIRSKELKPNKTLCALSVCDLGLKYMTLVKPSLTLLVMDNTSDKSWQ